MEEYVRELKKFEFERILSYVSDILRLREEQEALREKENEKKREMGQFEEQKEDCENDGLSRVARTIEEILKELEQQNEEITDKIEMIEDKMTVLENLVSKLTDYIFDEDFRLELQNDEIKIDFAEEYFYFIQEQEIKWNQLFEFPCDFIVTACIALGETKREFLTSMVDSIYDA